MQRKLGEKPEMGFEPTILRDLAGCSNYTELLETL